MEIRERQENIKIEKSMRKKEIEKHPVGNGASLVLGGGKEMEGR